MDELSETELNNIYHRFSKEQVRLLSLLQSGDSNLNERDITAQFTLLNTLMLNTMRYRNKRKKAIEF
jgi:hypothetical protein